jgi:hypothetical protein
LDYLNIPEAVLELPDHQVNVKPYNIKRKEFNVLSAKIDAARVKASAYGKLPPKPDESRDDWVARYAKYLEKENLPKKGEKANDYVTRMSESEDYKNNSAFLQDVLIACCDIVNQGSRITPAVMDEISTASAIIFVQSICRIGMISVKELPNLL